MQDSELIAFFIAGGIISLSFIAAFILGLIAAVRDSGKRHRFSGALGLVFFMICFTLGIVFRIVYYDPIFYKKYLQDKNKSKKPPRLKQSP